MNINIIIGGLIAIVIALIGNPFRPRTAKQILNKENVGYTQASFKIDSWFLLVGGILATLYGLYGLFTEG